VYEIEVRNPSHVCRGVKKITLNGDEVDRIPVQPAGSKSKVIVELG
jgi:N,N'-diacetylchitobiose phosphorylase